MYLSKFKNSVKHRLGKKHMFGIVVHMLVKLINIWEVLLTF